MTILNITLLSFAIIIATTIIAYRMNLKINKTKASYQKQLECDKVLREANWRNLVDFFWSEPRRFVWISIILIFIMLLGLALGNIYSYIVSFIFLLITIGFMIFARKSYVWFPQRAKAKLTEFEDAVRKSIETETGFKGDKYTELLKQDKEINTELDIYEFAVGVSKIKFPPLEENVKKQPIIGTKKLEFLVLYREYFSICQGASKFDLLDPARQPVLKGCTEKKGGGGECHEYYYSLVKNVKYEDNAIKIIFHNEEDNTEFKCKKIDGNRKPAMNALKEKLRITERQKLTKTQEHESYENLKDKREDY